MGEQIIQYIKILPSTISHYIIRLYKYLTINIPPFFYSFPTLALNPSTSPVRATFAVLAGDAGRLGLRRGLRLRSCRGAAALPAAAEPAVALPGRGFRSIRKTRPWRTTSLGKFGNGGDGNLKLLYLMIAHYSFCYY